MSLLVVKGDLEGFRKSLDPRGAKSSGFWTMPLALLMMVSSIRNCFVHPAVSKFHGGEHPDYINSPEWYCTGLFAFAIQAILNRAFYALHESFNHDDYQYDNDFYFHPA